MDKTYHITEIVVYRVRAKSAMAAKKKLLDHVKTFKDDTAADLDGVEFMEVSERDVVKVK